MQNPFKFSREALFPGKAENKKDDYRMLKIVLYFRWVDTKTPGEILV